MSSQPPDETHPWVTKILETIAHSSPIREGLQDTEALPLIDWGMQCASHLGQRLAAPGTPAQEQVDNTAYNLTRLMTRINWLATYRNKKDSGWLTCTFQMINQLARELFGDDAPVMSDQEIAAWITGHARLTNGEIVKPRCPILPSGHGCAACTFLHGTGSCASRSGCARVPRSSRRGTASRSGRADNARRATFYLRNHHHQEKSMTKQNSSRRSRRTQKATTNSQRVVLGGVTGVVLIVIVLCAQLAFGVDLLNSKSDATSVPEVISTPGIVPTAISVQTPSGPLKAIPGGYDGGWFQLYFPQPINTNDES